MVSRRQGQILAAEAEANWEAIKPEVIGKKAMKDAYASHYLRASRLATTAKWIAIDTGDDKGHERMEDVALHPSYYLTSEICPLSMEDRKRADKVAKSLGPEATFIARALLVLKRTLPDHEPRYHSPMWHLVEAFWETVALIQMLGLPTPGLRIPLKSIKEGRLQDEFWEPDPAEQSDLDIAHQAEEVIQDADYLSVVLRGKRDEAHKIMVAATQAMATFAYNVLAALCPKLPPDLEPSPALQILERKSTKNPTRRQRFRRLMGD